MRETAARAAPEQGQVIVVGWLLENSGNEATACTVSGFDRVLEV